MWARKNRDPIGGKRAYAIFRMGEMLAALVIEIPQREPPLHVSSCP